MNTLKDFKKTIKSIRSASRHGRGSSGAMSHNSNDTAGGNSRVMMFGNGGDLANTGFSRESHIMQVGGTAHGVI